jgi:hypothetical protein
MPGPPGAHRIAAATTGQRADTRRQVVFHELHVAGLEPGDWPRLRRERVDRGIDNCRHPVHAAEACEQRIRPGRARRLGSRGEVGQAGQKDQENGSASNHEYVAEMNPQLPGIIRPGPRQPR